MLLDVGFEGIDGLPMRTRHFAVLNETKGKIELI